MPRSEMQDVLLKAGWPGEQVRRALDAFADVAFPIPVPRPVAAVSARDAFMYGGDVCHADRQRVQPGRSVLRSDQLIAVVYTFLGGELTLRFVLKVAVVALIARTVFGYYRWDLGEDEETPET